MYSVEIDLFTVFIAAMLNMGIGFVWYSKWLFGPNWETAQQRKMEPARFAWVYGLASSFLIAYFLAFFQAYLGVATVTDGMFVGFCFWLGFVATTQISSVLWCKQPLRAFFIDTGYKVLSFVVMSGVIGA